MDLNLLVAPDALLEDGGVGVLVRSLDAAPTPAQALAAYDADRLARYAQVREHSPAVDNAADAPDADYARHYAAFGRWMPAERPRATS